MPKISNTYKNTISVIVMDALNNYINSENNPDENDFRRWLKGKKLYYLARITNELVSKYKPIERTQAVGYIAVEIYKIMERDYEPAIKSDKDNDTRSSE